MIYNNYTSVDQVIEWLRFVENDISEYHFGFIRKSDKKLIGSGSIGIDSKDIDPTITAMPLQCL
ncbi:MAG: hypothetical protein IJ368_07180 [Oscillospiraceae bacterium]|nr:hypothetical protein [Oscillospiraceae bacterium]